ncbi:hypothetical protein ColTof4_11099 [Colletotrichum tofieldiae]|nr:hypothetical protein ColTof3_04283 [Colletotrichum tofieldiae]GKT78676.1 hypothetical protein ColTof4_11099 [Colletotrichum tofieldiae]
MAAARVHQKQARCVQTHEREMHRDACESQRGPAESPHVYEPHLRETQAKAPASPCRQPVHTRLSSTGTSVFTKQLTRACRGKPPRGQLPGSPSRRLCRGHGRLEHDDTIQHALEKTSPHDPAWRDVMAHSSIDRAPNIMPEAALDGIPLARLPAAHGAEGGKNRKMHRQSEQCSAMRPQSRAKGNRPPSARD